ncbi:MAG: signal transduction histidine kinase/ligand-binding sensor domain-containing protein [Cyclobacteriaceae bacterium]|jgi:signal transduction histidine kinase/ligand-binding sensor domain-containing protein
MTFSKYVCFLLLAVGLRLSANAQDRNFNHFNTRSGLPSGFINTMMEDRYGYIWVGTNSGLSQFDGYNFINYVQKPSDSMSIKGVDVNAIKDYDPQTLLIATADGLNVYDRTIGAFRLVLVADSIPTLDKVVGLVVMENKDVWALSGNGLYFIEATDLKKEVSNVEFFEFPQIDESKTNRSGAIVFDGDRTLWVGSESQPIQKFDLKKRAFLPFESFSNTVGAFFNQVTWGILLHPNGDLFVVGTGGLLRWKAGATIPEIINPGGYFDQERLRNFQSITLDSKDRLLIGTGEFGAIRWDLETDEVEAFVNKPEDINTVNSDDVHYLFEDKNSNLWFGHHVEGLSMMYVNSLDYTFRNFTEELSLESAANLYNMSEDEAGNLWFSTSQGLIMQSKDDGSLKVYNPKEKASLNSAVAYKDKLFISSGFRFGDDSKVFTFDMKKRSFTKIYESDSVEFFPVPEESAAHIYFPGSSGFLQIDKETEKIELIKPPTSEINKGNLNVFVANQDVAGNLIAETYYIGADNIIETFIYDSAESTFKKTKGERKFNPSNNTPDFVSRSEPMTLWSRSPFGLSKTNIESGRTVMYFEGESLLNENASGSFREDNDGFIWMHNATGVTRLDPITQTITQYQVKKELKPEVFRRPFILKNGDILFTGVDGYLRFNPNQTASELAINNLLLTELKVNEKSYNLLFDELPASFSFDDNDVSTSYISFNYIDPIGVRYRYRVKGFNENWNNVDGQRRVFLANLPAGDYEFEVQSATRSGAFGSSQSIPLTILPPWWLTWWAYVLYASLFGMIFLAVYRVQKARTLRIEREKNKDQELAQAKEIEKAYNQLQETQKQLIHSEKMASLGELTAGIAHEIQNPLNFVNNFSDLNKELIAELREAIAQSDTEEITAILGDLAENEEKVTHHGKRAEEIVKSMLQHSRTGTGDKELGDINVIADEYLRLSYHGLRAKDKSFNAAFKSDFDTRLPQIMMVPQDIGRVLLNLINNAFFAVRGVEQPEVIVSTKKVADNIEISVSDNGTGIPKDIREKIFQPFFTTKSAGEGTGLGLSMSYDIVTKGHNGSLSVSSEEGSGTQFTISLPINQSTL